MTEEEFRPAVKLLLARMHSSPEEFHVGHNKYAAWMRLYDRTDAWGTEAEKTALANALSDIQMGQLHSDVMKLILREDVVEPHDPPEYHNTVKVTDQYAANQYANSSQAQRAPPVLGQVIPLLPAHKRFLEIGAFEGRSTVWFAENMLQDGGSIVSIDTWEGGEEHKASGEDMKSVEERFDHNRGVFTAKFPKRYVCKTKQSSYDALAALAGPPQFDFVYVDGSHTARDVLTDAIMAWPLIKPDGVMVFDDYMWGDPKNPLHRPKIAVDAFTNIFGGELSIVYMGYQLIVRKNPE